MLAPEAMVVDSPHIATGHVKSADGKVKQSISIGMYFYDQVNLMLQMWPLARQSLLALTI